MWIHPDLAQDKQWDSKKSKSKGKSCNVISILPDDGNVTSASLYDSEGEKACLHNTGRCTSADGYSIQKIILKQYEQITDETQQQTTSVQVPIPALVPTSRKEKQKEVRFDHILSLIHI